MLRAHHILPVVGVAAVLFATSACASGGYYRYPVGARPGIRQVDDRAYRNGFEEGRRQGENDARGRRSFDYGRHGEYRNAQNGYGGYGNRNEYRQVFRQGFETGYNEGYRRYARDSRYPYPSQGPNVYGGQNRPPSYGGPAYGSPAAQTGFRDGLEQGQRDARDRHPFDPIRASRYRSGDHEYNSRYGSRDEYKRAYRAAFEQGYDQGYRGARR
jgi:flagellar biosynthesis/type III secretory pathway protein FliH